VDCRLQADGAVGDRMHVAFLAHCALVLLC
jgi:hypothetical protein